MEGNTRSQRIYRHDSYILHLVLRYMEQVGE